MAGIGTSVEHQSSNASKSSPWNRIKFNIVTTVDQALGTSFVDHVLAGYRFIMRYYTEGDLIYIFGFSRGAYTARFLAEMLFSIGLLSRGNEEMVRFAWDTFSDYQRSRGNVPKSKKDRATLEYMEKFKRTFCRSSVGVYFLGLFDCVNSVAQFEIPLFRKSYEYIAVPPAKYIRHAVSIHERRLKFKPALFLMDDATPVSGVDQSKTCVKEVWFAGNHGDCGGGWGLQKNQQRLLSDTPLEWMLQELKTLPVEDQVTLNNAHPLVQGLEMEAVEYDFSLHKLLHDMLAFGGGGSRFATLQWWVLEILPIAPRLKLKNDKWVPEYWPPNLGARRDIPRNAAIHPTVDAMHRAGLLSPDQMPKLGGEDSPRLLPSEIARKAVKPLVSVADMGLDDRMASGL